MKKELLPLNYTTGHIFEGVYEMRPCKVIGIIISVANIAIISPAIYFLIWYEKCESNHTRSLINLFVSAGCWTALVYNILAQTIEVIIAFKGAVGPLFCYLHLLLKNVLTIQYTWQATTMIIIKYLYIYVLKNPSGRNDDFWCFFINILIMSLATLSQIIFLFLPGKNPYIYYTCSGENPTFVGQTKINYPFQFSLIILFIVYMLVWLKNRICSSNEGIPTISNQIDPKNNHLPSTLGNILKTMLASYATLATTVIAVLPLVFTTLILNGTATEKLSFYPYYHLIQFHSHICPFMCTGLLVISYFLSHKKLRTIACKKLREFFLNET
jgi:hypothetical protein